MADRLISLSGLKVFSIETIRHLFKNNEQKPWQKKIGYVDQMNTDYADQMVHCPLVCKPSTRPYLQ